nr:HIT domain-containing protein [Simplicispira psychrophila]
MPLFIDTSPPGQCIFCRLVHSENPCAKVYEDTLTIAFMDIGQVNSGHVLAATKRHAATLFDITPKCCRAVRSNWPRRCRPCPRWPVKPRWQTPCSALAGAQ